MKALLDNFYKGLKNDEHFITDLSKHGEAFLSHPEHRFLVKRVNNVIEVLAEYAIDQKSVVTQNMDQGTMLEKVSSEQREVTLIVTKLYQIVIIT